MRLHPKNWVSRLLKKMNFDENLESSQNILVYPMSREVLNFLCHGTYVKIFFLSFSTYLTCIRKYDEE